MEGLVIKPESFVKPLADVSPIIDEVKAEVLRAVTLHGPLNTLHEAHSVIEEEFDEFWELVKTNPKKLTEQNQRLRTIKLREELVQVAAMAVRTIMDLGL